MGELTAGGEQPSAVPEPDEGVSLDGLLTPTDRLESRVDEALFRLQPYDHLKHKDTVRRGIAYWLLGILSFLVVAPIGLLLTERWTRLSTDDIRLVIELLFSPLVTLIGAVTGFYYGEKTRDESH